MSNFITLANASQMTATFRQNREAVLDSNYQNQDILPKSETFDRADLESILAQTGCVRIRIYYGMETNLKMHAIFVGVNENDEDMILVPNQSLTEADDEGLLLQGGVRCPEICPPESELND
ncbi:MAG: hypothetical protein H0V30_06020 [Chitinophagaceae bacterium]|jgi:hypothetical protein|nr:hypothetical protein [Chitinophagaceae bacterium]